MSEESVTTVEKPAATEVVAENVVEKPVETQTTETPAGKAPAETTAEAAEVVAEEGSVEEPVESAEAAYWRGIAEARAEELERRAKPDAKNASEEADAEIERLMAERKAIVVDDQLDDPSEIARKSFKRQQLSEEIGEKREAKREALAQAQEREESASTYKEMVSDTMAEYTLPAAQENALRTQVRERLRARGFNDTTKKPSNAQVMDALEAVAGKIALKVVKNIAPAKVKPRVAAPAASTGRAGIAPDVLSGMPKGEAATAEAVTAYMKKHKLE
jgi:hypothetical protein